ncbi:MAG: glycosyltransferase [Desulfurococcus sp.]|nr:glycosyltransferase [Desulfurococcus sp.]
MRIAVVHHGLNTLGGAERLCLSTIEAFVERGWHVILATIEPTDWSRISSRWGSVVKPDEEITVSIPVKGFTIYKRLLTSLIIPGLRRQVDLVVNTHGDALAANADITYMHFPVFTLWEWAHHKYERGFWRLYFTPYYLLQKELAKRHTSTVLLTNSSFSASVIYRALNRKALVLYPPVDIDRYISLEGRRETSVVSIGRFSPEKRYEFIVEVAERLRDTFFYIAGSVSGTKESRRYYEKIKSMVEEKDLKNVELIPDASDKKLMSILSTAKIYLHSMINEHFGISIVEGMSAGLVPVVHKSGGPWHDIVEYGRYGYGYLNTSEAVEVIKHAISSYDKMKDAVRIRSMFFSKNKFKKKIVRVVEKYAELKV